MANTEDRRLWIGNLDSRITEFQLLKIVQQCGPIEKFDVLFHKSGPQCGQPRGYAFVTYKDTRSAARALDKLHGHHVGSKTMVVRMAKNINYDELEKPRGRLEIPALAVGKAAASADTAAKRISTQTTIQAIEAKLKSLENNSNDLVINKSAVVEPPLIQRYQYNKLAQGSYDQRGGPSASSRYTSKSRYTNGPYKRTNHRR